jgi:hypothetical protein
MNMAAPFLSKDDGTKKAEIMKKRPMKKDEIRIRNMVMIKLSRGLAGSEGMTQALPGTYGWAAWSSTTRNARSTLRLSRKNILDTGAAFDTVLASSPVLLSSISAGMFKTASLEK